jgi:hypothetical protein
MSILPLVIIVGALIALGFTAKVLFEDAVDFGKRKGEGKK